MVWVEVYLKILSAKYLNCPGSGSTNPWMILQLHFVHIKILRIGIRNAFDPYRIINAWAKNYYHLPIEVHPENVANMRDCSVSCLSSENAIYNNSLNIYVYISAILSLSWLFWGLNSIPFIFAVHPIHRFPLHESIKTALMYNSRAYLRMMEFNPGY